MKMLRYSGLAVFVVCIAAFASGCGGGGGGSATTPEEPPVMECPQGQVGTYPNCTDPGPTDEQKIAAARETIAGIVNDANRIEQAARSAVTAVEASADATAEQIADARAEGNAALDALRAIVRASGVANAATTPAAAEGAVASARAALSTLSNAQSAAAAIQRAVEAVANLREQQAEEERLATNGSSLIQHVRDNKLVYDTLLTNLGGTGSTTGDPVASTIEVSAAGATTTNPDGTATCVAPCAVFPADSGSGSARVVGDRKVQVKSTVSNSKTPTLTGTGRLPYGFDLKNDAGNFVNAYTDITKTRLVSTRVNGDNSETTDVTEEFYFTNQPDPHSDYLLAGIWIDGANSAIKAFAYGGEAIEDKPNSDFCTALESFTPSNVCASGNIDFNAVTGFVDTDKDMTATYRGDANGAYMAGGAMSYFTADVAFTAEFQNAGGVGKGSIQGNVTNITAAGKSIAGDIELQKHTFADDADIGLAFGDDAIGVVAGKSYSGTWLAQFFGLEARKTTSSEGTGASRVVTTTYKPQAPRSVAGTFHVTQQSNPAGSTAFIGAFATKR